MLPHCQPRIVTADMALTHTYTYRGFSPQATLPAYLFAPRIYSTNPYLNLLSEFPALTQIPIIIYTPIK